MPRFCPPLSSNIEEKMYHACVYLVKVCWLTYMIHLSNRGFSKETYVCVSDTPFFILIKEFYT